MKKLALVALFVSALTCTANSFAQTSGPDAGRGPAHRLPDHGPRPPFGDPTPTEGLRAVTTTQGKVVKLKENNDFTFDGFYILNGTDSLLIKFPAHMGTQISPLTRLGSQVSVSGVLENPPFGTKEIRMVNITAGGKTITDTPPVAPAAPAQETATTGNGKVTSFQKDREGKINGLFVDNKTVLRLPPHATSQIENSVTIGATIAYSGNQKTKQQGEVSLGDYKVIRCSTITINGQQYLVK